MSALPKWFQEGLDEIDRKRAVMMKMASFAPIVDDALSVFADIHPHATPYDGDITITVWVESMTRVVEMLRHLRAAGFKVKGHSDHVDSKCRLYRLQRDDGAAICVMVYAVGGEGAACAFVQTGTKEVPVYELKCKDAAEVTP